MASASTPRQESNRPRRRRASSHAISHSTVFPIPGSPEITNAVGPAANSARNRRIVESSSSRPTMAVVCIGQAHSDGRLKGVLLTHLPALAMSAVLARQQSRCRCLERTALLLTARKPRPSRATRVSWERQSRFPARPAGPSPLACSRPSAVAGRPGGGRCWAEVSKHRPGPLPREGGPWRPERLDPAECMAGAMVQSSKRDLRLRTALETDRSACYGERMSSLAC